MSDGRGYHVPQRTCVACGRKRAKHELLRLLTDGEGNVVVDPDHRGVGRGVYLCPEGDCLARPGKTRSAREGVSMSAAKRRLESSRSGDRGSYGTRLLTR